MWCPTLRGSPPRPSLLTWIATRPSLRSISRTIQGRPSTEERPELCADVGDLALVGATPELLPLRVLADPDDLGVDSGVGRRRPARLPDGLRVEGGLLGAHDLPERLAELVRSRVAPEPEAAPVPVDAEARVEDEREREIGPVKLVRELEQIELLGDRPVLVREEGEVGAQSGAEGAVHVRLVDGDDGDLPVLALDLVLEGDEVAQAHLLLRAPPAAHEGEHERLLLRDLAERQLLARRLGQAQVGERVAGSQVVSHRLPLGRPIK